MKLKESDFPIEFQTYMKIRDMPDDLDGEIVKGIMIELLLKHDLLPKEIELYADRVEAVIRRDGFQCVSDDDMELWALTYRDSRCDRVWPPRTFQKMFKLAKHLLVQRGVLRTATKDAVTTTLRGR